jgi:8-oxo-dGTP pyrophosphatase MutT (NUDIX family)
LSLGKESLVCKAKVDPGAQVCLFKRELGEELGIDIESGYPRELDTLAGSLFSYGHTVVLHTLGLEFDSVLYFAESYGLRRNLLGREGWLQKIRLAIIDYDSTIYLSPYNEP